MFFQVESSSQGYEVIQERAKDIFDKLDSDGDGELSREEFVNGYLRLMTGKEAKTPRPRIVSM